MNSGFQGFQQQQRQWQQERLQAAWWEKQQREKKSLSRRARGRVEEEQRKAAEAHRRAAEAERQAGQGRITHGRRRSSLVPPVAASREAATVSTPEPTTVPPVTMGAARARRFVRWLVASPLVVLAIVLAREDTWPISAVLLVVAGLFLQRNERKTVAGVASSVELRFGERYQTLAFRLQRWDRHGEQISPLAVMAKGSEMRGQLRDGDRVEVHGHADRSGRFKASEILCLDTGETVKMRKKGRIARAIQLLTSIIVTGIWVLVVYAIISAISQNG